MSRAPLVAWTLWAVFMAVASFGISLVQYLRQDSAEQNSPGYMFGAMATFGAYLAARRPANPIGWMLVAPPSAAALLFAGSQYAETGGAVSPADLRPEPFHAFAAAIALVLLLDARLHLVDSLLRRLPRPGASARDRAFAVFFGVYVAAAVVWLLIGAAPAIARSAPGLHDALHAWGGGEAQVVVRAVPATTAEGEEPTRTIVQQREVVVSAGQRFVVTFIDEHAITLHNLSFYEQGASQPFYRGYFGGITNGQMNVVYQLAPLPPGEYVMASERDPAIALRLLVVADDDRAAEPFATIARRLASLVHGAETGPLVESEQPGLAAPFEYFFSALNLAFGIFLVRLRPRDTVARLLALGMVGTAAVFNLQSHSAFDVAPALVGFTHDNFHLIAGVAYVAALLLFPDGRLRLEDGGRSRWLVIGAFALVSLFAYFVTSASHGGPATFVTFFGVVVPLAGVTSQAWRYGHPLSLAERQQSRVLMLALAFVLVAEILLVAAIAALSRVSGEQALTLDALQRAAYVVFPPLFALIPLTLFVVLLRFRLWDIDRVVNRAVVYALLTGILAAAYFGSVVLLQRLLGAFTQGSEVAIALSTLAVAALFQPVRQRVQAFIDRRFYRHRYDAMTTVREFTGRLRQEIDLGTMERELVGVVREALEPTHVSLWLAGGTRPPARRNVPGTPAR